MIDKMKLNWIQEEIEIYLDFSLVIEHIFATYYEKFETPLDDRRIDAILALIRRGLKEGDIR